jgi:hypothetical protein
MVDAKLITEVIAAVRRGEAQAQRYTSDRIIACPNRGEGEEALAQWRRDFPHRTEDSFIEPLVRSALEGQ